MGLTYSVCPKCCDDSALRARYSTLTVSTLTSAPRSNGSPCTGCGRRMRPIIDALDCHVRGAKSIDSYCRTPGAALDARTRRQCETPVLFTDRDLCKDLPSTRTGGRRSCPVSTLRERRRLRATTGWCGHCSQPWAPTSPDAARLGCGRSLDSPVPGAAVGPRGTTGRCPAATPSIMASCVSTLATGLTRHR